MIESTHKIEICNTYVVDNTDKLVITTDIRSYKNGIAEIKAFGDKFVALEFAGHKIIVSKRDLHEAICNLPASNSV